MVAASSRLWVTITRVMPSSRFSSRIRVLSDLNPARDNVFYYTLGKTMESSKVATQFS